jgi:outer membrane protein assembly factor BamA
VDPDRGIFASTALEYASSWTSDDTEYVRGQIDLRGFKTLFPRLVVAGRGQTILTSGTVPSYRDLVVGGAGSIRGQPSEVLRGTSIARSSVELRFKLLKSRRFGFTVPLLPEKVGQFTNFDLRIDGELFFDAGSAWTGAGGFDTAQAKYGAGFGFRFFLPVFELVRLELAFDEEGNATFYFREGNII